MVLFLLVAALVMFPRATLGFASDNTTISVIIQQLTEITVDPPSLSFSTPPCRQAGQKLLDIRNTGSVNVSQIHAYVSTLDNETYRPYGMDNGTAYASTGLLVVQNETNSTIYWAGRLEWNWTEDISNKDMSNMGNGCTVAGGGNCSWGFVRNSSYEYMWAVSNGTGGYCNTTGTELGLEPDEDNGTAASRTPEITSITRNSGDSGYSYFSVDRVGHLLEDHCVAVDWNCSKIYIYKYDKRTAAGTNFNSCTNSRFVQIGNMPPNDVHTLTLDVYAPCGIPDGDLSTGIIYIEAKT